MTMESLAAVGVGGAHLSTRLPKILYELQNLRRTIVAGAAANALLPVPLLTVKDTIASVIMFAAGVPSDITSTCSVVDSHASGTLTLAGVVVGDTVTVNGKVYTAIAAMNNSNSGSLLPYKFALGATDTATALNLAAALNSMDGDVVIQAAAAGAVVTVKAVADGTVGNAIALVGSAHITASAATLAGGSATQGLKTTTNTTGNTLMVEWYKKSTVIGQWS